MTVGSQLCSSQSYESSEAMFAKHMLQQFLTQTLTVLLKWQNPANFSADDSCRNVLKQQML